MSTEIISTHTPDDDYSFDAHELAEALAAAVDTAVETDGEAFHYIRLEDGRHIGKVVVNKETLSDGSIVCELVLLPAAI